MPFAPWEPPIAGTEFDHLFGMLERLRATFWFKAEGLTSEQLRRTLSTSALSLGVLLKHLACCEDEIFQWKISGQQPPSYAGLPEGTDLHAWQFTLTEQDTADVLYRRWSDAVTRSRQVQRQLIDEGLLDAPASLAFGELRPSNRRFVCDFVEEMGRHTGHADLLREAVDGRVGEDPDSSLRLPY